MEEKGDKELNKIFVASAYYEDRIDLMRKVLAIYNSLAVILGWPNIAPRHIDLIAYYICYGYSENTQKRYCDDFNIKATMLSVMNSDLKKNGLLVDLAGTYRTRNICPRLQRFRNYFANGDPSPKLMAINFIRKSVSDE